MSTIHYMTAIKRMKQFTDAGVNFSFEFYKLNGELKVVNNASIRASYRNDQSKRSKFLIAYYDHDEDVNRQFHRALLFKLNGVKVSI